MVSCCESVNRPAVTCAVPVGCFGAVWTLQGGQGAGATGAEVRVAVFSAKVRVRAGWLHREAASVFQAGEEEHGVKLFAPRHCTAPTAQLASHTQQKTQMEKQT